MKELENLKLKKDRSPLWGSGEGSVPLYTTLHERLNLHQVRRQEILTEMAGLRRDKELPVSN